MLNSIIVRIRGPRKLLKYSRAYDSIMEHVDRITLLRFRMHVEHPIARRMLHRLADRSWQCYGDGAITVQDGHNGA